MVAELGLHRPQDLAFFALEGGLLELRDHFAFVKPPQVAASLAGGTLRVLSRHLSEALAASELVYDLLRFLFVLAQNVGSMNLFYHA